MQNEWAFRPKVSEDQEKKRSSPNNKWVFGLKKTRQMVSRQNGDTRGGPPPLPPSDSTGFVMFLSFRYVFLFCFSFIVGFFLLIIIIFSLFYFSYCFFPIFLTFSSLNICSFSQA